MKLTKQQLEALPIVDKIIASGEAQKGADLGLPWLDSNDPECRQTGRSTVFAVALVRAAAASPGRSFRVLDHYCGEAPPKGMDLPAVLEKAKGLARQDPRLGASITGPGPFLAFARNQMTGPIENWMPPVLSGEEHPDLEGRAKEFAAEMRARDAKRQAEAEEAELRLACARTAPKHGAHGTVYMVPKEAYKELLGLAKELMKMGLFARGKRMEDLLRGVAEKPPAKLDVGGPVYRMVREENFDKLLDLAMRLRRNSVNTGAAGAEIFSLLGQDLGVAPSAAAPKGVPGQDVAIVSVKLDTYITMSGHEALTWMLQHPGQRLQRRGTGDFLYYSDVDREIQYVPLEWKDKPNRYHVMSDLSKVLAYEYRNPAAEKPAPGVAEQWELPGLQAKLTTVSIEPMAKTGITPKSHVCAFLRIDDAVPTGAAEALRDACESARQLKVTIEG
jgi:hypothetical protein